jgi:hypothetical protein
MMGRGSSKAGIENEQSGNVDVKGDVDILITQRRKTRQALKKLSNKF